MRVLMAVAFGLQLLSGCGPSSFPALPAPPAAPAQTAAEAAPVPAPQPMAVTPSRAAAETAAATPAPDPAPLAADAVRGGAGSHVVTRGETLSGIAQANGLDANDLAVWNRIDDPRKLQIGTELRLSAPGN